MRSERPHKKLLVWQEAMQLAKQCYSVSNKLPDHEKFGIISQLRRASVSVALNIAEGAARRTEKEYIYLLYISSGSLSEVDAINELMKELDYISIEDHDGLRLTIDKVSALLAGLIKSKTVNGATKPQSLDPLIP